MCFNTVFFCWLSRYTVDIVSIRDDYFDEHTSAAKAWWCNAHLQQYDVVMHHKRIVH